MKKEGKSLLVVDDETPIREWIASCIKDYQGIEHVKTARNGEEALKLFKNQCFDIVLTDITMPHLDGLSLLIQIKKTNPDTTVVIMSVHNDFEHARSALKNGAFDYILKNEITQEGLYALLDRISHEQGLLNHETDQVPAAVDPIIGSQYIEQLLTDLSLSVQIDDLHENKIFLEDAPIIALALPVVPESLPRVDRELSTHLRHMSFLPHGKSRLLILANCDADNDWVLRLTQVIRLVIGAPPGRSRIYPGISELPVAVREALVQCDYLFYEPSVNEDLPRRSRDEEMAAKQNLEKLQNQAVDHYRQHRCDRAIDCFRDGLALIAREKIPDVEYIKDSIAMTINRLAIGSKTLEIDTKSFEFEIRAARNMSELKNVLEPLFSKIAACENFAKPIGQAIEYISQQYNRSITLADVADAVHLNEEYFSRLFKKEVGMNFTEYLLNLRMDAARNLLLTTDLKIARIAEMVGIFDSKYFSLLYKKTFDQTPSQVREGH